MSARLQILFLFICLSSLSVFAQDVEEVDPMPIKLKGQVLNLDDESPVPFAFVLNYRTHAGVTTDDQGRFTLDMLNIDSLAISSLGFSKTTARVPANYNQMNVLILYAKPIRFAIPEVKVQGDQKKVNMEGVPPAKKLDIDPQLRGDAYNEKPPVIAAFFNPASFLQYYISKSEREKRETRRAIITEKQWEILSQFYKKDLVMELTGLNDAAADDFMLYINSKGLLSHMSTEYDVRAVIREQFKIYKQEGH
ncbi:MAG: carboxypeptidase-like regulatory domain-containing protein [Prolixibacteraceae bacterium]|nr:carboxypeptidase-like regulatory domain-containing protein [Prolixibacteraceae bacterium]